MGAMNGPHHKVQSTLNISQFNSPMKNNNENEEAGQNQLSGKKKKAIPKGIKISAINTNKSLERDKDREVAASTGTAKP